MRNLLALIAGGATAGAAMAVISMMRFSNGEPTFGPTESRLLPWVLGVIVWFSIKNAGGKQPGPDGGTA